MPRGSTVYPRGQPPTYADDRGDRYFEARHRCEPWSTQAFADALKRKLDLETRRRAVAAWIDFNERSLRAALEARRLGDVCILHASTSIGRVWVALARAEGLPADG